MTTIKGHGKPQGFQPLSEGLHILQISDIQAIPRVNPTQVTMKMLDKDGRGFDKYPQSYDLTKDGGYAAFYFLVKNGLGVDLGEGDEFDLADLEGAFVEVEIVHKESNNPDRPFANIKATVGPAEGFEGDDAPAAPAAEDDDY